MAVELSELIIPISMSSVAGVAGVIGSVTAVGATILGTANKAKEYADTIDELSTKTGLSADEAAGLNIILQETGVDAETGGKGIGIMNKGLVDIKGNAGPTGKVLQSMGIDIKDANGNLKPTSQLLQEASTKLQAIKDPAEKARLEMLLFGKSGTELDDTLSALADGGLTEAEQKAKDLGLAVGSEGVTNAENMQKVMADLQLTLQGFAVQIGGALIPILNQLIPVITAALNRPEVQAAINALMNALIQLVSAILPVIPALMPLITNVLPILITLFVSVINAIMPMISAILPPLITLVVKVINAFMPLLSAILPPLTKLFTGVITAIMPLLSAILPPLITLIVTVITAFMPLLNIILPPLITLFTGIVNVISQIITAILPPLITLIQNLTNKFNEWLPVVKNVASFLNDKLKGAFQGIADAIGNVISWIQRMIDKLLSIKLPSWLKPGSPTPFELGLRGINDAMKDINQTGLPALEVDNNINNKKSAKQEQQPVAIDYQELASVITRTWRQEFAKLPQ